MAQTTCLALFGPDLAITAHPDAPCVVISGGVLVVTWGHDVLVGVTAVVRCGGCSS